MPTNRFMPGLVGTQEDEKNFRFDPTMFPDLGPLKGYGTGGNVLQEYWGTDPGGGWNPQKGALINLWEMFSDPVWFASGEQQNAGEKVISTIYNSFLSAATAGYAQGKHVQAPDNQTLAAAAEALGTMAGFMLMLAGPTKLVKALGVGKNLAPIVTGGIYGFGKKTGYGWDGLLSHEDIAARMKNMVLDGGMFGLFHFSQQGLGSALSRVAPGFVSRFPKTAGAVQAGLPFAGAEGAFGAYEGRPPGEIAARMAGGFLGGAGFGAIGARSGARGVRAMEGEIENLRQGLPEGAIDEATLGRRPTALQGDQIKDYVDRYRILAEQARARETARQAQERGIQPQQEDFWQDIDTERAPEMPPPAPGGDFWEWYDRGAEREANRQAGRGFSGLLAEERGRFGQPNPLGQREPVQREDPRFRDLLPDREGYYPETEQVTPGVKRSDALVAKWRDRGLQILGQIKGENFVQKMERLRNWMVREMRKDPEISHGERVFIGQRRGTPERSSVPEMIFERSMAREIEAAKVMEGVQRHGEAWQEDMRNLGDLVQQTERTTPPKQEQVSGRVRKPESELGNEAFQGTEYARGEESPPPYDMFEIVTDEAGNEFVAYKDPKMEKTGKPAPTLSAYRAARKAWHEDNIIRTEEDTSAHPGELLGERRGADEWLDYEEAQQLPEEAKAGRRVPLGRVEKEKAPSMPLYPEYREGARPYEMDVEGGEGEPVTYVVRARNADEAKSLEDLGFSRRRGTRNVYEQEGKRITGYTKRQQRTVGKGARGRAKMREPIPEKTTRTTNVEPEISKEQEIEQAVAEMIGAEVPAVESHEDRLRRLWQEDKKTPRRKVPKQRLKAVKDRTKQIADDLVRKNKRLKKADKLGPIEIAQKAEDLALENVYGSMAEEQRPALEQERRAAEEDRARREGVTRGIEEERRRAGEEGRAVRRGEEYLEQFEGEQTGAEAGAEYSFETLTKTRKTAVQKAMKNEAVRQFLKNIYAGRNLGENMDGLLKHLQALGYKGEKLQNLYGDLTSPDTKEWAGRQLGEYVGTPTEAPKAAPEIETQADAFSEMLSRPGPAGEAPLVSRELPGARGPTSSVYERGEYRPGQAPTIGNRQVVSLDVTNAKRGEVWRDPRNGRLWWLVFESRMKGNWAPEPTAYKTTTASGKEKGGWVAVAVTGDGKVDRNVVTNLNSPREYRGVRFLDVNNMDGWENLGRLDPATEDYVMRNVYPDYARAMYLQQQKTAITSTGGKGRPVGRKATAGGRELPASEQRQVGRAGIRVGMTRAEADRLIKDLQRRMYNAKDLYTLNAIRAEVGMSALEELPKAHARRYISPEEMKQAFGIWSEQSQYLSKTPVETTIDDLRYTINYGETTAPEPVGRFSAAPRIPEPIYSEHPERTRNLQTIGEDFTPEQIAQHVVSDRAEREQALFDKRLAAAPEPEDTRWVDYDTFYDDVLKKKERLQEVDAEADKPTTPEDRRRIAETFNYHEQAMFNDLVDEIKEVSIERGRDMTADEITDMALDAMIEGNVSPELEAYFKGRC